jgi:hypothetical protein
MLKPLVKDYIRCCNDATEKAETDEDSEDGFSDQHSGNLAKKKYQRGWMWRKPFF